MGNSVIEFKGVSKTFGDRLLIDDLSMIVPPGAIVGTVSYTHLLRQDAVAVASGERTGTITIRACKDATCAGTYAGTSGSVNYRLTVTAVPDLSLIHI